MAKFRYFASLSGNIWPEVFSDDSFHLRERNKSMMSFQDRDGATVELHGTGFHYSKGEVTSGVVKAVTVSDADGNFLMTVKHANLSAVDVYDRLDSYKSEGLYSAFGARNDRLVGSNKSDNFSSGEGNDILDGRGGNDYIFGEAGNDTLTGGEGNDVFIFHEGYGIDRITDFEDSGKTQDRIWLESKLWHRMETTQHKHDVVLDFESGDEIIIEHARKADIGREDFHFI